MLSVNNSYQANTAALAALRQTNIDLAATQKRVASGLKVSSASDDATVWATAQGIRSDMAKESTVASGLSTAKGRANLTLEALNKISDILASMKTITDQTVAATSGDTDDAANTARSAQLDSYQAQLDAITKSVTFQGANWLQDTSTTSIVLSTNSGADVSYAFTPTRMYAADGSAGSLKAAIDLTTTGTITSGAQVTAKKDVINNAISAVNNYITTVKGVVDVVTRQEDFLSTMSNIRKEALSNLVDADMTEESAKLQALQVKQQLAYQALAIGNQSAQNILRLFQ